METVDDWKACNSDLKAISKWIEVPLKQFIWIANKTQLQLIRQDESEQQWTRLRLGR